MHVLIANMSIDGLHCLTDLALDHYTLPQFNDISGHVTLLQNNISLNSYIVQPPSYYVTNFVFSASRLPRLLSLDCGDARRKSAVCMKAPTNTPLGKRHGPNLKLPFRLVCRGRSVPSTVTVPFH